MTLSKKMLRLRHQGHSLTAIAEALSCSPSTVSKYLNRLAAANIDWAAAKDIPDDELEKIAVPGRRLVSLYAEPDYEQVFFQTRGSHGCTLREAHRQYVAGISPESGLKPITYQGFCKGYSRYTNQMPQRLQDCSTCFARAPAQTVEIDYSGGGHGVGVTDPVTLKFREAQVFVAVLPYSNLLFAFATEGQKRDDWLDAIIEMYGYLGGVPDYIDLDNSTSLVTRADKYAPKVCSEFASLCSHYGAEPFPVRPGRPKDKAHVENGVGICQRQILSRLAEMKFFSLDEINRQLREKCDELNNRPFSNRREESRRSIFEAEEKDLLNPLPPTPWEKSMITKILKARKDGCIRYLDHRYSVPGKVVGSQVRVQVFPRRMRLQVFTMDGTFLTEHALRSGDGGKSVKPEHMSAAARYSAMGAAERLEWLSACGEAAARLAKLSVSGIAERKASKLLAGYQSQAKRLGKQKFDEVCAEALADHVCRYEDALKYFNKDSLEQVRQRRLRSGAKLDIPQQGGNIRGAAAYGGHSGNEGEGK